jgi:N-acylglucosamine 2-epimerase
MSSPSANLPALRDFLADHLFKNILPFWMTFAQDPAGGINTCLRDDGSLVSRDKWLWSQWRAVWVFSKLANTFGQRPEGAPHRDQWLDFARRIYDFPIRHGYDEQTPGWKLRLSGGGRTLQGCESIYADGFAIYGCVEYAKATGDPAAAHWAAKTGTEMLARLQMPHDQIPHFPYPVPPGAKVHGLYMNNLIFWELGQFLNDDTFRNAALEMNRQTIQHFLRPEFNLILERIAADNRLFPAPLGTAVVPGHVIEDMWFQIHIHRDRRDAPSIARACQLIQRHLEAGWDTEFGGLFLAIDAANPAARGDAVGWKFADTKLWWPHTEALYALLLAYEQTRQPWCLQWYDRIHEYAFSHYPQPQGEWTQRLDRQGQIIHEVVALPVKDPFHLPRALILCIQTLDRLTARP